ncbi:MAG TPA: GNAT family N-acetyltransferase [Chitinophagaceae bacterium]|jgi:hypothetical protein|nr:GNAT family N-acetyltransferase [Chitinophagaceae bacterium]
MSDPYKIVWLRHEEIDKGKWDDCIHKAHNGLIYAYSFYLDTMAVHWDALVMGDYEAVMPLTWNKKYGIKYLYQPFLAAQLGVFGAATTWELVSSFIRVIPASFRFAEISLNSKNNPVYPVGLSTDRINHLLDLNKPYETLRSNYGENIRRNARKASQAGCFAEKEFAVEKVIELAAEQMKSQGNEEKENIERFRKLFQYLHPRQMAMTYGIFSNENKLLASAVFFFSHNRAYYILVGNHPDGKSSGASHALIDTFIKDHAGKDMLLDFEGSDILSLAQFYRGFGAIEEKYPAIRINRLPFYLRWLK